MEPYFRVPIRLHGLVLSGAQENIYLIQLHVSSVALQREVQHRATRYLFDHAVYTANIKCWYNNLVALTSLITSHLHTMKAIKSN
jgi:hypothetical protein